MILWTGSWSGRKLTLHFISTDALSFRQILRTLMIFLHMCHEMHTAFASNDLCRFVFRVLGSMGLRPQALRF